MHRGGLVAESARGRLTFHQGTAAKRLRALRHGGTDPLIRAGGLRPGDRVLDATLGLGRDSLVAAWALGPGGAVLGVEADLVLAVLAADGFAGAVPRPGLGPRAGPSRRLPAGARGPGRRGERVDVVLLDPMFTDPRASDHGFALARDHTVATPLTPEWVALARAVARRWVVVTAERARPWFPDVGLVRLEGTRSGRWFRAAPRRSGHRRRRVVGGTPQLLDGVELGEAAFSVSRTESNALGPSGRRSGGSSSSATPTTARAARSGSPGWVPWSAANRARDCRASPRTPPSARRVRASGPRSRCGTGPARSS